METIDREFRPPEWVIREGFESVFNTIEIENKTKEALFNDFKDVFRSGDSRKGEKVVFSRLKEIKWIWKEFDKWHETFASEGRWPPMWYVFAAVKDINNKHHKRDKCRLLACHLSATIYILARYHQGKDLAIDDPSQWNWQIATSGEDPIENEFAEKYNLGLTKNLPPFFPGDRNRLRLRRSRS